MKVNFKRMITVLAATAMCAVPMTSAMSASAAPDDKVDEKLKRKITQEAIQAFIHEYQVIELPEFECVEIPRDYKLGKRAGNSSKLEFADQSVKDMVNPDYIPPRLRGPVNPPDPIGPRAVVGLK
jgi:hypothetical protein